MKDKEILDWLDKIAPGITKCYSCSNMLVEEIKTKRRISWIDKNGIHDISGQSLRECVIKANEVKDD